MQCEDIKYGSLIHKNQQSQSIVVAEKYISRNILQYTEKKAAYTFPM